MNTLNRLRLQVRVSRLWLKPEPQAAGGRLHQGASHALFLSSVAVAPRFSYHRSHRSHRFFCVSRKMSEDTPATTGTGAGAGAGAGASTHVGVTIDGREFKIIKEGLAEILEPRPQGGAGSGGDGDQPRKKTSAGGEEQSVFYNPIQQFNRDLSILAARVFAEDLVKTRAANHARKGGRKKRRGDVNGNGNVDGNGNANGGKRKRDDVPSSSAEAVVEMKRMKVSSDEDGNQDAQNTADDDVISAKDAPADGNVKPSDELHGTVSRTNGQTHSSESLPKPHFRVLDALSGTGLRALRYAKEVPEVTHVTANDLSREATEAIRRNIEHNGVKDKVIAVTGNAASHMYHVANEQTPTLPGGLKGKYDLIDLDPYGTAAPFIDAAVQALSDGGMLSVTCTDSSIFASLGYLEKTFSQYGGVPWKGSQAHEAGLRLIIQSIAVSAARYGLAIEPLLSLSIDYYTRMFIRVRKNAAEVKLLAGKSMVVFNCDTGCHSWSRQSIVRTQEKENRKGEKLYRFTSAQGPTTSPLCEHCGFKMHIAGPMWGGPLHNPFFVQRLLDTLPQIDRNVYGTVPRLEGMLTLALHETLLPPSVSHVKTNREDGAATDSEVPQQGAEGSESNGTETYKPIERLDPAVPDHHPFFFTTSELSHVLHCSPPPDAAFRGALMYLGYRVTRSHTKAGSIRTDAPFSVIWDIMRAWASKDAPVKKESVRENTAGWGIWRKERGEAVQNVENSLMDLLRDTNSVKAVMGMVDELMRGKRDQSSTSEASAGNLPSATGQSTRTTTSVQGEPRPIIFDEVLGKDHDKRKLVRYQVNPRENWGPQVRAK